MPNNEIDIESAGEDLTKEKYKKQHGLLLLIRKHTKKRGKCYTQLSKKCWEMYLKNQEQQIRLDKNK